VRYPEIAEMQARAIFEAAVNAARKTGKPVIPEVMIPLVAYRAEFDIVREAVVETARAVEAEAGAKLDYQIGTMIELPRACLKAGEIAAGETGAQFFSFGTNDLTQTCLGLSRDDAAPILSNYTERAILPTDPFVSIDQDGVGELVRIGTERGRKVRPDLKVGICGEHGGDPASIRPRLRLLLRVPRAGGPPGRRPGGHPGKAGHGGQRHGLKGVRTAAPDALAQIRSASSPAGLAPAGRTGRPSLGQVRRRRPRPTRTLLRATLSARAQKRPSGQPPGPPQPTRVKCKTTRKTLLQFCNRLREGSDTPSA
jgi:hypothetical protein